MQHESWATSPGTRESMRSNRGRDTQPELAVRRLVHAAGLRYRVDSRPISTLNRRADLVFAGPKIAVFIDGCFWHGCPDHHTVARSNPEYWATKLSANRSRDAETNQCLEAEGWQVLRYWEHEDAESVADAIVHAVRGARQE